MIMYKTGYENRIEKVIIERETGSFVWIAGQRFGKRTDWWNFHATWSDAREFLIKRKTEEIQQVRMQLERLNGRLGTLKGMKDPADAAQ